MATFTDIADLSAESQAAIEYLAKGEIVKGVGGGAYNPGGYVTREHMAIYLWRTLNWTRLVADDLVDSTLWMLLYGSTSGVGGGTAWWRAPRVMVTNEHVAIENVRREDGTVLRFPYDFMARGNGGWVRANLGYPDPDPQLYVIWDKDDPRDIAYLIVPQPLWDQYLAVRESVGLPREPKYVNPNEARPLVQGEPIAICGAPLMYEATVTSGIISKVEVVRTEGDLQVEYAMTTAAINPGNSGGLALTFDRKFAGMPSLKPWALSGGFGPSAGDDMGLILTAPAILSFEQMMKWKFDAAGVVL